MGHLQARNAESKKRWWFCRYGTSKSKKKWAICRRGTLKTKYNDMFTDAE